MGYLTGLSDLVQTLLADPKAPKHHIRGFPKLSARGKRFVFVASLCSYPCDTLLGELLEDDRVALRLLTYRTWCKLRWSGLPISLRQCGH